MEKTITQNLKAGKEKNDQNKIRQAKSRQLRLDERLDMGVNIRGGKVTRSGVSTGKKPKLTSQSRPKSDSCSSRDEMYKFGRNSIHQTKMLPRRCIYMAAHSSNFSSLLRRRCLNELTCGERRHCYSGERGPSRAKSCAAIPLPWARPLQNLG